MSDLEEFLEGGAARRCGTCQLAKDKPDLARDLKVIQDRWRAGTTSRGIRSLVHWLYENHGYPYKQDALHNHLRFCNDA